jgi:hypothetical protein
MVLYEVELQKYLIALCLFLYIYKYIYIYMCVGNILHYFELNAGYF